MKLECCHADTCLPDYWPGHHKAHLQISVWPGMSMCQIKEALRSELRQGAVAGTDRLTYLLAADLVRPEEEKEADAAVKAAYAAINRMRPAKKGQRKFFTEIDPPEDDGADHVYAFFVLQEI